MSRNQWIVIVALVVPVVLVFGCLGGYMLTYLLEAYSAGGFASVRLPSYETLEEGTPTPPSAFHHFILPTQEAGATTTAGTPRPQASPTSTPSSTVGISYRCGNSFYVSVGDGPHGWGPWLTYEIGDAHATGIFLVVPIALRNVTNRTFDRLWQTDYEATGLVQGWRVTFTADRHASWNEAYAWRSFAYFTDDVPPGVWFYTLVVFDVNPEGRNWALVFQPDSMYGSPICRVEIPLRPPPYDH